MFASFFSTFSAGWFITNVMLIIGLWKIFKKCKKPGWWAFIPAFREYQLAKCANRENEGRMYLLIVALTYVLGFVTKIIGGMDTKFVDDHIFGMTLLLGVLMTIYIANLVYSIRIFSGVFLLFGVSKRWMWLVILLGSFFPSFLLGVKKKYQPLFIYIDPLDNEGAALSGLKAEAMESGLTVNIEERTAMDFFKKRYLLRDIHLNIEPGHMVLLLGGSGAGKTTFVNAVNGYEKAKTEIILNGSSIYDDYGKMKYKIGFVPQIDLMRGNDSVLRTLLDSAKLRLPADMHASQRKERAEEALKFFGL